MRTSRIWKMFGKPTTWAWSHMWVEGRCELYVHDDVFGPHCRAYVYSTSFTEVV